MTQPQRPTRTPTHRPANPNGDRLQQVVYIVTTKGYRLALSSAVCIWTFGGSIMLRYDGSPLTIAEFASPEAADEALEELWAEVISPSGCVLNYRGIGE